MPNGKIAFGKSFDAGNLSDGDFCHILRQRPRMAHPPRKTPARPQGKARPTHRASARAPLAVSAKMHTTREDGLHRIAKLLARAGVASRRDVERMIADGRVTLHGQMVEKPATLLANLDGVAVDGQPIGAMEQTRLFLFNKPVTVLTAARDPGGRQTIYDILPSELPRLMPIGRLDFMTEGLLLLTNDGALKRALELPRSGIARTYRARAFGTISQTQLEDLIEGITIDGINYGRIDANLERRTGRNQWIEMTITEGKNREVRRILEHLGLEVSRLIRTRYGQFSLGDAPPAAIEEVAPRELNGLLRQLGLAE